MNVCMYVCYVMLCYVMLCLRGSFFTQRYFHDELRPFDKQRDEIFCKCRISISIKSRNLTRLSMAGPSVV